MCRIASLVINKKKYVHQQNGQPSVQRTLLRFVLMMATFNLIAACLPRASDIAVMPTSMPMPEFIVGSWQIVSAVSEDTGESWTPENPRVFIHSNTMEYGDVLCADYRFVDASAIHVDNRRILGGEDWRLERQGQRLIVHNRVDQFHSILSLERVADSRSQQNCGDPLPAETPAP
jgi:hypothetical protein